MGWLTTNTPPDDVLPRRQTFFAQYPTTTASSERCDANPLPLTRFDVLPDDVILGIFTYYLSWKGSAWPTLVHVCQRWRNVVLESPGHLKLRLYCTRGKPVRRTLDIWPPLPVVVDHMNPPLWEVDNIVAALECNDRVRDIDLKRVADPQLQIILAEMEVSFPTLTNLTLMSEHEMVPVVPDSFLKGSAPRLRYLVLSRIAFPGLPKLLLSATNIVYLALDDIPHSGYISPEAMATCLSTLTRLISLSLGFQSPRPPPDQESQRPPPPTRFVLPALTQFLFRGVSQYLEDLVARIDVPLVLKHWRLDFVFLPGHQLILDTPQLAQFLSRIPKLKTCKEVHVMLLHEMVAVRLYLPFSRLPRFFLTTTCKALNQKLSFLAQVCRSSLSLLPSLEHLCIIDRSGVSQQQYPDDFENNQWLDILRPFVATKNLYLSKETVPRIAPTLQLVGESLTAVLPSLQILFLEKPYPSGPVGGIIGKFISARQLSGRPIVIRDWDGRPWSGQG